MTYTQLSGWMDEWTGADQQREWELLGGSSGERDDCPKHHTWQLSKSLEPCVWWCCVPVPTTNRVLPRTWTTVMEPGLDKSQSKPFINWNQGLRTDSPQMGSCVFYAYPFLDS